MSARPTPLDINRPRAVKSSSRRPLQTAVKREPPSPADSSDDSSDAEYPLGSPQFRKHAREALERKMISTTAAHDDAQDRIVQALVPEITKEVRRAIAQTSEPSEKRRRMVSPLESKVPHPTAAATVPPAASRAVAMRPREVEEMNAMARELESMEEYDMYQVVSALNDDAWKRLQLAFGATELDKAKGTSAKTRRDNALNEARRQRAEKEEKAANVLKTQTGRRERAPKRDITTTMTAYPGGAALLKLYNTLVETPDMFEVIWPSPGFTENPRKFTPWTVIAAAVYRLGAKDKAELSDTDAQNEIDTLVSQLVLLRDALSGSESPKVVFAAWPDDITFQPGDVTRPQYAPRDPVSRPEVMNIHLTERAWHNMRTLFNVQRHLKLRPVAVSGAGEEEGLRRSGRRRASVLRYTP